MRCDELIQTLAQHLRELEPDVLTVHVPARVRRTSARRVSTFPYMDTSTMWLRGPRGESRGVSWDRHLDIDCVANMRDIGAEDDAALIATVLEITRVAGDALFDAAGRGIARVSNGVLIWGVGGENLADVLLPPVTVYEPEIDI